jgi:4-aminobutyrate aminotransferase-like enzyme
MLSCDGPGNNVLKIKPPLVITEADVARFTEVFAAALRSALK